MLTDKAAYKFITGLVVLYARCTVVSADFHESMAAIFAPIPGCTVSHAMMKKMARAMVGASCAAPPDDSELDHVH